MMIEIGIRLKTCSKIVKHFLDQLNINPNRLIVLKNVSIHEYMNLYNFVDICLDTFPYSGTTTTCESLFMSRPVITMSHPSYHAHSVSGSILNAIGFPEWIATSQEDYIQRAVELATDRGRLQSYKARVRDQFISKMNPVAFTEEFQNMCSSLFL